MTFDKQIRREALRLYFKEGMTHEEVCEAIEEDHNVSIPLTTFKEWTRSGIGRLYKKVNCTPITNNSIKQARNQEKEQRRDILSDSASTGVRYHG